jgi:nucleotide-binding universal stress UspA family protein
MYNTILLPLDGSERAERIFPHVEELAHKFAAKLLLVRVVEPILIGMSPYNNESYYIAEELERRTEEAKTYLAGLQAEFAKKAIQVQTYIEYGTVVATILEIAEREQADLIALSSHGRTGLARVFYGSVAAGILQRADRPLLLIRAQE